MQDSHLGNWTRGSTVSVETLESLRELNHRFLDLTCTHSVAWRSAHGMALPPDLSGRVAALSSVQKKAIADCPYALFDLRFCDDSHWRLRLQTTAQWSVSDAPVIDAQTLEFVRVALFFAWHVAATAHLAARFLLGMNEMTVAAFRGVTIDCLPALAATESVHLAARWSDCPAYWAALTGAACRPNAATLRRVQLSGLQLAAALQLP
jgi:hypothetical protein